MAHSQARQLQGAQPHRTPRSACEMRGPHCSRRLLLVVVVVVMVVLMVLMVLLMVLLLLLLLLATLLGRQGAPRLLLIALQVGVMLLRLGHRE